MANIKWASFFPSSILSALSYLPFLLLIQDWKTKLVLTPAFFVSLFYSLSPSSNLLLSPFLLPRILLPSFFITPSIFHLLSFTFYPSSFIFHLAYLSPSLGTEIMTTMLLCLWDQVQSSKKLPLVLRVVLDIGNKLNQGTPRGMCTCLYVCRIYHILRKGHNPSCIFTCL